MLMDELFAPSVHTEILANRDTLKTHNGSAVYLWRCQTVKHLYFDPWQLYYCSVNTAYHLHLTTSIFFVFPLSFLNALKSSGSSPNPNPRSVSHSSSFLSKVPLFFYVSVQLLAVYGFACGLAASSVSAFSCSSILYSYVKSFTPACWDSRRQ